MQEMLAHLDWSNDDVETKTCIPMPEQLAMGKRNRSPSQAGRSGMHCPRDYPAVPVDTGFLPRCVLYRILYLFLIDELSDRKA